MKLESEEDREMFILGGERTKTKEGNKIIEGLMFEIKRHADSFRKE